MKKNMIYLCLERYNFNKKDYYNNPENFINNITDSKIKEELLFAKKLDENLCQDWCLEINE